MSLLAFVITYVVFAIASMMTNAYIVIGILLSWIFFKDWAMSFMPSWMIPSLSTYAERDVSYADEDDDNFPSSLNILNIYKSY